jgi:hypothetical protein
LVGAAGFAMLGSDIKSGRCRENRYSSYLELNNRRLFYGFVFIRARNV